MPADDLLRPGDFGARARLSAKALRLYADQGLLVPASVDEHTGYRGYEPAQLDRARLIALLRQAGMPLARVRDVLDLGGPDLASAVGRWWVSVEADVRQRRELVRRLDHHLTGGNQAMYDVQLRKVTEQKLLSTEQRLTVDALDDFISASARSIDEHLSASGVEASGLLRVIYHGMVTEDSDGPVEVARPFEGSVEPVGDLRVRLSPAGSEAYTRLDQAQVEFPGILDAYDAVSRWIDERALQRSGSPAEIYVGDRRQGDDEAFVDVAWPVVAG